jgi:hypothetical protein
MGDFCASFSSTPLPILLLRTKISLLINFFTKKHPEFYNEKNVHQVILRNYATATAGVNQIPKNQRYYLRVNTKKSVKF